jgi:hypothetical protein
MRLKVGAVIAVAVLLGSVGTAAQAKPFDGGSGSAPCIASDGTTVVGTFDYSPAAMWPPNHKMRDVTVNYTDADNDGDAISFSVDSVTNSEDGLEEGATANHAPDVQNTPLLPITGTDGTATPDLTTTFQVRSERMGTDKAGRTYTITVSCTDAGDVSATGPSSGTATLTVLVPHSRGHHH